MTSKVNLGKKWSSSLSVLVGRAIETAKQSKLKLRHGAILFASMNQVQYCSCNEVGHHVCGYDVPSLHAEAQCLRPIYNRTARRASLGGVGKRCHQGKKGRREKLQGVGGENHIRRSTMRL